MANDEKPGDDQEAIKWLLEHHQPVLTVWELDFLGNVQEVPVLSPRRKESLNRIWQEVVVERRRR